MRPPPPSTVSCGSPLSDLPNSQSTRLAGSLVWHGIAGYASAPWLHPMPLAEAHTPATIALASRTGDARAVRGCFDGRGGATWGRAHVLHPIMRECRAAPSPRSHSRPSRAVAISRVNTDL